MKRRILGYVAVMATVICLCAAPSFAADNFKVGVGYQGLISGNILNGASVRGWYGFGNMAGGLEVNGFYGAAKLSVTGGTSDLSADLWMLELKPMFAFVVRENSRFYAGLKGGYGKYSAKTTSGLDGKFWELGGLVGAEWNFPSLKEVGFNFEVGYNYISDNNSVDGSPVEVDIKLHGINVGAGIKYYF